MLPLTAVTEQTLVNWETVDTIMLDMDGTLLDLHFDNDFWQRLVIERYAEREQLSLDQAGSLLNARFSATRGTLAWYSTEYWAEQLGLDIVGLKRELSHKIRLRPHTEGFLRAARCAGKALWLLTNAHPQSLQLKLEKTALAQHFDVILSSHELNYCKEQPEFWQALHRRHPYCAERSLFVDDTDSVLSAAQQAGIGQVLAILSPDSCQSPRGAGRYPGVDDFDQVMPVR